MSRTSDTGKFKSRNFLQITVTSSSSSINIVPRSCPQQPQSIPPPPPRPFPLIIEWNLPLPFISPPGRFTDSCNPTFITSAHSILDKLRTTYSVIKSSTNQWIKQANKHRIPQTKQLLPRTGMHTM